MSDNHLGLCCGIVYRQLLVCIGKVKLNEDLAFTKGVQQVVDDGHQVPMLLKCLVDHTLVVSIDLYRPIQLDWRDNRRLSTGVVYWF